MKRTSLQDYFEGILMLFGQWGEKILPRQSGDKDEVVSVSLPHFELSHTQTLSTFKEICEKKLKR